MTAFPIPFSGCCIDLVRTEGDTLLILAHTDRPDAACPACGQLSSSVHTYYQRKPTDLPISDLAVRLLLQVRRFRCRNPDCPRRTFAERIPALIAPRARRTLRLEQAQRAVGFALGGEPGARLLRLLHMPTSPESLLRLIRLETQPERATPRVLGVDDWAFRRGRRYGTVLVDLERHRVVDLLRDRSAEVLMNWLREHPGIEIITRDRSTEYARGISLAAPEALQVADRWHLLDNLNQLLERFFRRIRGRLAKLPQRSEEAATPVRSSAFARTRAEAAASQASRAHRRALYDQVQHLRRAGYSIGHIARELGLSRGGVRTLYYAEAFPERARPARQPSLLDPYVPYLEARLAQGCENASQLWRELEQQGFSATRQQVLRYVRPRRLHVAPTTPGRYRASLCTVEPKDGTNAAEPGGPASAPRQALPSPKQLAWLAMCAPEALEAEERSVLAHIRQAAEVERVCVLAQRFVHMIREREAGELDRWLEACFASGVESLQSFAAGLRQDYGAVRAALETVWSNGQSEGQVNRLKLLKRQMYGRAKFDLLRQRVLHAA